MRPERKIARLREYDYSQNGMYAVTICAYERRLVFGTIENGEARLNRFGKIAYEEWLALSCRYAAVTLDEFVVMPNHLHGILFIEKAMTDEPTEKEMRSFGTAQSCSLSAIIGNYKSGVTRRIAQVRGQKTRVWQERFWDHVIRDERDLQSQ